MNIRWAASLCWFKILFYTFLTIFLAFCLRMLEWPCWQNPEYRLGNEMLLATHDAYHWLAGAVGFGRAVNHPMSVLLRTMSDISGLSAATIAFWFPAVLASFVAGIVFIWVYALERQGYNLDEPGGMQIGIAAGIIASISPGFLGRTLLGYYDTDLITLFFPLLIAVIPAAWAMRFLLRPGLAFFRLVRLITFGKRYLKPDIKIGKNKNIPELNLPGGDPLSPLWITLLGASGIISFWTQQWHSVFPYLIRYNIFLLAAMILLMAPKARRQILFIGALAYALPALAGLWGLIFILALIIFHILFNMPSISRVKKKEGLKILFNKRIIFCLWCVVIWLSIEGDILNTIINQVNAYLKHSGDTHLSAGVSLVFPSVAQSIIEVQDLSFGALFPYFHPWLEASILGMAGYILVIFKRPGALFLLPLAALGLLSSKFGGRMVMFGAPIVAIGITLPVFWFCQRLTRSFFSRNVTGWICCVFLCSILVVPFLDMIPALSQGPIINRRHAAALSHVSTITPEDSLLWIWWDWGYAAHYFARRETIADGAMHGGPSLYLPAAVFATDNPRFARQVIRYLSEHGNEPGNFFKGKNAYGAESLIYKLKSTETPLVKGQGRQFIAVSFEMLRLGFWISNFGNWNFITCRGEGGALSIITQALAYKLDSGEVRLADSPSIIFPTSINVFDETGVTRRNYVQEWFDAHPKATVEQQKAWLASRRNINFLFNRVTDEKLAVDEGIYNSLMIRLLLCDPHDPKISPYFKLVYDNVFARIYEVLPASGK